MVGENFEILWKFMKFMIFYASKLNLCRIYDFSEKICFFMTFYVMPPGTPDKCNKMSTKTTSYLIPLNSYDNFSDQLIRNYLNA